LTMKTIIILILIYIAYRVLKRIFYFKVIHHPHHPGAPGAQQNPGPADEELVQDPVCGSYVPLHTAVSADAGGRVVYFCSTECRDKFLSANT